jgi:RNA polymerase sigma-70 factor (ECF subfamily)
MLFEQYAGTLMTVCLRYAQDQMEAEDILQESFIRIFKYIYQFKSEGSFEGWLRRIVVNTALKKLEKKKIHFSEITEYTSSTFGQEPGAYSNIGEEDILKLIKDLPEGYRLVFNLNVIEGFSHEEIAKILHIQAATSRSQLAKARKMLQNQIIQMQKIAV